jgi:hypothetical protein
MRSLPIHYRRGPRSHERVWRNRCVDRNLKDYWLISLNELQSFDLISICEGHSNRRRTYPHINLRLKEEYFPIVSQEWYRSRQIMSRSIDNILSSEKTAVEIKLEIIFRKRNGRYNIMQNFIVKMQCLHTNEQKSINSKIISWFDLIISEIQEFDTFIFDLCREIK